MKAAFSLFMVIFLLSLSQLVYADADFSTAQDATECQKIVLKRLSTKGVKINVPGMFAIYDGEDGSAIIISGVATMNVGSFSRSVYAHFALPINNDVEKVTAQMCNDFEIHLADVQP